MSTIPTKAPQIPAVPNGIDPATRNFLQALKQVVELREGTRGQALDAHVSFRDLVDADVDISKLNISGAPTGGGGDGSSGTTVPGGIIPIPYMNVPPTPTNFAASGGVGIVFLTWDNPRDIYTNHDCTEVWRGLTSSFAGAGLIGTAEAGRYVDEVGINPSDPDGLYHYWIRFKSTDLVYGAFAGPVAGGSVYDILVARITATHLYEDLGARIDLIDGAMEGSVAARISTLQEAIVGEDGDTVVQTTTQLTTTQEGHTTTLEEHAESLNGLAAQWTVKIDADGYVAGFGLAVYPVDGEQTSDFIVRAEKFAVVIPEGGASGNDISLVPFVIGVVDGEAVVTMSAAAIGDATITSAKIVDLVASKIKTGTLVADTQITVGTSNFVLKSLAEADGSYGQMVVSDNNRVRALFGRTGTGADDFGLVVYGPDGSVQFDAGGARVTIDQAFINDLWAGGFKVSVPDGAFTSANLILPRPYDISQGIYTGQITVQSLYYDPQWTDGEAYPHLRIAFDFLYFFDGTFFANPVGGSPELGVDIWGVTLYGPGYDGDDSIEISGKEELGAWVMCGCTATGTMVEVEEGDPIYPYHSELGTCSGSFSLNDVKATRKGRYVMVAWVSHEGSTYNFGYVNYNGYTNKSLANRNMNIMRLR